MKNKNYGYDEVLAVVGARNIEQLAGFFGRKQVEEIEGQLHDMFGQTEEELSSLAQRVKQMCENYLHGKLVIKNINNGQLVALELIDKNGVNWIRDYIGNAGGFGRLEDGLIECDPDNDIYLASDDTINWWVDILVCQHWIDEHTDDLREKYGTDIADQLIDNAYDGDLESTVNELVRMLKYHLDIN